MVSDGEDVSTPELVIRLAAFMHCPARLISVPMVALHAAGGVLGRQEMVRAICGSLQVDIGKARKMLDWVPTVSLHEGLRRAVGSSGETLI